MATVRELQADKWKEENEYIQALMRDSKLSPALKNLISRKIDHFSTKLLIVDRPPTVEFHSGAIHGLVSLYKDLFGYLSHGRNLLSRGEEDVLMETERKRDAKEAASRPSAEPKPYRRDLG